MSARLGPRRAASAGRRAAAPPRRAGSIACRARATVSRETLPPRRNAVGRPPTRADALPAGPGGRDHDPAKRLVALAVSLDLGPILQIDVDDLAFGRRHRVELHGAPVPQ